MKRIAWVLPLALLAVSTTGASAKHADDLPSERTIVATLRAPLAPESLATIRAGLKSTDARVRAVTGRVASVSDPSRFVSELSAALAIETEAEAAREEAWALALGDPVGALGTLLGAAQRGQIRDGVLEALGAARGAMMPTLWPALPKSLLVEGAPALVRGARRTGNLGLIAPLVLRDQLLEGWSEALSGASLDRVAPSLLASALRSQSSRIRTEAYLALLGEDVASELHRDLLVPADIQEGIARRLFEAAHGLRSEIELDREMLRLTDDDRRLARVRLFLMAKSEGLGRARAGLSQAEAEALRGWLERSVGPQLPQSEQVEITSETLDPAPRRWRKATTVIGTIKGLPGGFVEAVRREWGCESEERSIAANVLFTEDGRPGELRMAGKPVAKGCGAVARVLFTSALGSLPKGRGVLVLPAYRRALDCLAATRQDEWEPQMLEVMPSTFASDLREPIKTKNLAPPYVGFGQRTQTFGDFQLRGVLTREGCLVALEGHRVSAGTQDLAVIDAVAQWEYSATVFRGTKVPVRFELKTSFALN